MLWTGKQVFNVLMRPTSSSPVLVNVETKCNKEQQPTPSAYSPRMSPVARDLSPNDGYLVIVNSEIMCGVMDKATVGGGKKKSVFGVIMRDFGNEEAAGAMNRMAKLCARWLGTLEFLPSPSLSLPLWLTRHSSEHRFLTRNKRRDPGPGPLLQERRAGRRSLREMPRPHPSRQEGQA